MIEWFVARRARWREHDAQQRVKAKPYRFGAPHGALRSPGTVAGYRPAATSIRSAFPHSRSRP